MSELKFLFPIDGDFVNSRDGFWQDGVFYLDVLLQLCDRIMVLCGGQVSGILDARTTNKNEVGMLMTRVGGQ